MSKEHKESTKQIFCKRCNKLVEEDPIKCIIHTCTPPAIPEMSQRDKLGELMHIRWYNHLVSDVINMGVNPYFSDYNIHHITILVELCPPDEHFTLIYEYVPISPYEYQWGLHGNILTNYQGEYGIK